MGRKQYSGRDAFRSTLRLLVHNAAEHNVTRNAAALAYYLVFAIFPIVIFISNLLGLLDLDIFATTRTLARFLPKDVIGLVEDYLDYVSHTSSHLLMWFSLVFSIWFPMRAIMGLMDDVRLAYHQGKPDNVLQYRLRQFAYTFVMLIVIVLSLVFSTLGKHVLEHIDGLLPGNVLIFSDSMLSLWQFLRFIPVALLMFGALGALYSFSLDTRPPAGSILPGLCGALVSWLLVSIAFSFYVENFAHYSLIYGTMGAVVVLLMWLYISSIVLILGAELNAAITMTKAQVCAEYSKAVADDPNRD